MLRLMLALLIAVYCMTVEAAGGVYKWVDENGTVHYRDTPPPQGSRYEVIHTPAAGTSQDPAAVMEALRKKVDAVDQARAAQQQQRQTQDIEAVRAQNCQQARQNLEVLTTSQNVVKEIEGKRVAVTPQQRQQEIQKNQKYVEDYCNKP